VYNLGVYIFKGMIPCLSNYRGVGHTCKAASLFGPAEWDCLDEEAGRHRQKDIDAGYLVEGRGWAEANLGTSQSKANDPTDRGEPGLVPLVFVCIDSLCAFKNKFEDVWNHKR
jgi:hypothetical protein